MTFVVDEGFLWQGFCQPLQDLLTAELLQGSKERLVTRKKRENGEVWKRRSIEIKYCMCIMCAGTLLVLPACGGS